MRVSVPHRVQLNNRYDILRPNLSLNLNKRSLNPTAKRITFKLRCHNNACLFKLLGKITILKQSIKVYQQYNYETTFCLVNFIVGFMFMSSRLDKASLSWIIMCR